MTTAPYRAIAAAIAAAIQTETGITVTRTYRRTLEREELPALTVLIIPGDRETEIQNRASNRETYTINLGVFIPADTDAEMDAAADQTEDLVELWGEDGALRGELMAGAQFTGLVQKPWDPDYAEAGIYHSTISLTYEATY